MMILFFVTATRYLSGIQLYVFLTKSWTFDEYNTWYFILYFVHYSHACNFMSIVSKIWEMK